MKDYPSAAKYYKDVLTTDPNDAFSHFRLGVVLFADDFHQQATDGFWELAGPLPSRPRTQRRFRTYLKNRSSGPATRL